MSSLSAWLNPYGDLQTSDPTEFAPSSAAFASQLGSLLSRPDAQRGVWVRLPWSRAELLPVLAACGFKPHHWAHGDGHLVLHAWRRDGPNPTPLYSHTDIGCGALVVNAEGYLLGVCERYDSSGRMNPPGGHLDEGEDLLSCAAREAREEAGVDAVALGLACLHEKSMPWAWPAPPAPPPDAAVCGAQEHAVRWGTLHHGFWVLCAARSDALAPDPREVTRAEWLPPSRWAASFTPWVLVMVRAAEASGQIAAAAAAAAELRAGAVGPFPAPATLGAAAVHLTSKYGAPHAHVFYHAQPLDVFAGAAAAVARERGVPGVRQLGRVDPALLLPPPLPPHGRSAPLLAAATLAFVVGAALGYTLRRQ
jgi:8-oxo-dGTP pyrophosphatase MutT (NUDIX family)